MATRNSKRTIAVPLDQIENLHKGVCDTGSFIHLALEYIEEGEAIDGSDILAVRTLLLEGQKRLATHIEPLGDLIPAEAVDVKGVAHA